MYFESFTLTDRIRESDSADDIKASFDKKYDDLDADGADDLLTEIEKLTAKIKDKYGCKPLILITKFLCCGVKVTVDWYMKKDDRPDRLIFGLNRAINRGNTYKNTVPPRFCESSTGNQALDEAMLVFNLAADIIQYEPSTERVAELVEICILGYALGPLSGEGHSRDIFNWWLCDVIPASILGTEPTMIFNMKTAWPKHSVST